MASSAPHNTAEAFQCDLRPCEHQVAGHLFEEGKAGSLVDSYGRFYKPLQVGPRGKRERIFYETLAACLRAESAAEQSSSSSSAAGSDDSAVEQSYMHDSSASPSSPAEDSFQTGVVDAGPRLHAWHNTFSVRNAALLNVVPRFFGVRQFEDRSLLVLEDVACRYKRPSIIDIKIGYQTWYQGADARYIEKCRIKDRETTQSLLGFKVCGMQVYRQCQGGYWRCSKRWCKKMPEGAVDKALWTFAHNEGGLRPADIFGGPDGAIAQLKSLQEWFGRQNEYYFYSSSVLIMYEGMAECAEDADVAIRLVDFAHTFPSNGRADGNFHAGLSSLIARLSRVSQHAAMDCTTL